jgi:alkylation response protein AidB-like acyl-CoA dehydrogenase
VLCFEQAFKYALTRETFGKPLVSHQIIRYKLAEMARQIESLFDNVERVAYQVVVFPLSCYALVLE